MLNCPPHPRPPLNVERNFNISIRCFAGHIETETPFAKKKLKNKTLIQKLLHLPLFSLLSFFKLLTLKSLRFDII